MTLNLITIESRMEHICKLKYNLKIIEAILRQSKKFLALLLSRKETINLLGPHFALSTFERLVSNILLGIQNERRLAYTGDIIVYSSVIHDHLSRLIKAFITFRKAETTTQ